MIMELTTKEITEELLEAQADLQNAIGFFKLCFDPDPNNSYTDTADRVEEDFELVKDRAYKSLARLHTLMDNLGLPMYNAATHPDISVGPTNHSQLIIRRINETKRHKN